MPYWYTRFDGNHIRGWRVAAVAGAVAASLGYLLRLLLNFLRVLPGVVGPLVVVYGVWLYDPRIAYILAGLILWAADLRIGRPKR